MSERSILEAVNVRRLLNTTQRPLEEALENNLFEPNVPPCIREYVKQQASTIWTASPDARIELRGKTYYKEDMGTYINDVVILLESGEEIESYLYLKLSKPIERITFTAKFVPNA